MKPMPIRRLLLLSLAMLPLVAGCAGPNKLAERSQKKLAGGDPWQAWRLATRALEREPMNPRAREAVAAAGEVIATDWQRRIHALAAVDSLRAAEQVLAFADFRAEAAAHTTIAVAPDWTVDEQALRHAAAHHYHSQGRQASSARRPKAATLHYRECERFLTGYRDASRLAAAAHQRAITPIAVLPFAAPPGETEFGRNVAEAWRDALAQQLTSEQAMFTRVIGGDAMASRLTLAQLGRLTRDEAVKLGRKGGARQVVWGSLGHIESQTGLEYFRDVVARRIVSRDGDGNAVVRWVEMPIEVVARVRDVTVDVEYEVLSTVDGTSLAHERAPRSARARVVWTSFVPEGDVSHYALVSDVRRQSDPVHAKAVESRWKQVCGESTTLQQVLVARREARESSGYDRGMLGRFVAGTAFVFLQELPPARELAEEAVRQGWRPLLDQLARLDAIDEVDLGVSLTGTGD